LPEFIRPRTISSCGIFVGCPDSTEIEDEKVKAALQSMPLRAITEWVEDSNGHQFFASQHQNYAPDQVLLSSQSFGMIGRYI